VKNIHVLRNGKEGNGILHTVEAAEYECEGTRTSVVAARLLEPDSGFGSEECNCCSHKRVMTLKFQNQTIFSFLGPLVRLRVGPSSLRGPIPTPGMVNQWRSDTRIGGRGCGQSHWPMTGGKAGAPLPLYHKGG